MTTLYSREWPTTGRPKARVLLVHGYAEHSGRYEATAAYLNGRGFHVFAYDQRGHGRSAGRRGAVPRFGLLVDDLDARVAAVAAACPDIPLFLLGHSMGGLVVLHHLAAGPSPIAGAIFSSPLLAIPEGVPAWKLLTSRWLGAALPWLPVERLDAAGIARDPDVVAAYEQDPLVYHGPIRARTAAQLLEAIQGTAPLFARFDRPMLVLHGTADLLVPVEGTRRLHARAQSEDKTAYWEAGGFHELLNDTGRGAALQAIAAWLNRQVAGGQGHSRATPGES